MFLLDILRLIAGFIEFKASGGFSERFINLCAIKGLELSDTRLEEGIITASIAAKDFLKLRPIAKKSGMKLVVTKKRGVSFFLKNHKNRYGLLIGLGFFVLFMYITSLFVWNVDVIGCEKTSKELIAQTIAEIGVYEGKLKSTIDTEDLTNQAMIRLSGKVSWLAINIKGTRAVVEVRDFEEKREDVTYGEPCNIVADFDGLILTLEVYNGQKANSEGNGVNKGDLLISAIVENRNTSSQFMEARGKITALHDVNLSSSASKTFKCKKYFLSEKRKRLSLFSVKIPLGIFKKRNENYDQFSEKKQLQYGNTKLPFAIITDTRAYYKSGRLSDENSVLRSVENFTAKSYDRFSNTRLLSSKIKLSTNEKRVNISSDNSCIDFMGVKEKIF